MKSFNINSTVKVRLTKYGEELHKKDWEDFWSSMGRLSEYPYTPYTPDADGYVEFQMWDLMEKFGKHCGWGGDLPFDTVILIEDNDLKGKVETDEKKLLKECRQTGRTNATTEKVLKTVFSQMTDKKTLECEIEEYALGIEQKAKEIGKLKDILDRKEQQLKQMKETDTSKLLKEMENHKSPAEEAYKEIYGIYPVYPSDVRFGYFKTGYNVSKEECKVEEPKPKKLFDVIRNLGYSVDMCYEIVDAVRCWLPEPQSAAGSQNVDVELLVDGFNDCLKKIKDGLG